ncbi:MAG: hypothetical protein J5950_03085 [Clostridia bacterium]|nr:hypothetical protein [Clostridia bacterium]
MTNDNNTPAVSTDDNIFEIPTIDNSKEYSKVVFVLADDPTLYEEKALSELRLFFGKRFEQIEQTEISQYSVQKEALTDCQET